jgi:hypothetical protein
VASETIAARATSSIVMSAPDWVSSRHASTIALRVRAF